MDSDEQIVNEMSFKITSVLAENLLDVVAEGRIGIKSIGKGKVGENLFVLSLVIG